MIILLSLFSLPAPALAADLDLSVKRGLEAVRRGEFPSAVAHFEKALERTPGDVETLYLLAATHYAAKDFVRAKRTLDKLFLLAPKHAKGIALAQSIAAIESETKTAGGPGTAEVEARAELDAMVARAAELAGKPDRRAAMDAYAAVLARDPERFDALLALARLESLFGDPARALAHFDRLIKLYPSRKDIYPVLRDFLDRNVRAEEAARLAEQYMAWGADRAEMRRLAALAHLKAQNFERAALMIGGMIIDEPDSVDAHRLLVDLHRAKGDLKNQVEALKTLKRLTHNDPAVVIELSRALEAGGVYDLALKTMGDVPPDLRDAAYFRRLVDIGKRSGEKALVAGAFERILQENPGDRRLALEFVDWLTQVGEAKKAVEAASRYVREEPSNPDFARRLRDAALASGDDAAALEALERYVELFPNSFANRRRLEKLAKKLGKKVSIRPVDPTATLPVASPADFSAEVELFDGWFGKMRDMLRARLAHECLATAERDGVKVTYANVRALERIANEYFMARTDAEQIAGYRLLMDFFLEARVGGVFLLLEEEAGPKAEIPHGITSMPVAVEGNRPGPLRLILVTNAGGKPAIERHDFDLALPPKGFRPPEKRILDADRPVDPTSGEYDDEGVLRRYAAYGETVNRIEVERRTLRKEILERCESRVPADIARNAAAIRALAFIEGIRPAHLPRLLEYLASTAHLDLPVDLLDEIERTYALLGRVNQMAGERSTNLIFELNAAKGAAAREAVLAKYCRAGDPLWRFLSLNDE